MSFPSASTNILLASSFTVTNQIVLQNPGDAPLSGISGSFSDLAPNLSGSVTISSNALPGMGTTLLTVALTANDASIPSSVLMLHVTSAEGASADLALNVSVVSQQPVISVNPAQLSSVMLLGAQTVVQFDIQNNGGTATGPVNVILPSVPWISLIATNPLPSLAPGGSNRVSILLTPPTNLPPGAVTGALAINCASTGVQVPFSFTAVSSASGSLIVRTVDEYTFFGAGAPPLTNAQITVLNPLTQAIVATGNTDTNGLLFIPSLPQGVYEVDAAADQHAACKGAATVVPGQTNGVEAFLSIQAVSYNWTVVPSEIEEQSTITIDTTFQTDVPTPVVVPTPASFDLTSLDQPGKSLDVSVTLVNHGLIAAKDVVYSPPSDPNF
jgi:hypothetical protein